MPNAAIHERSRGPGAGSAPLGAFVGRLLVILAVGAVAAVAWRLSAVLVLLFGAIVLAIGLNAATRAVVRATGIRQSLALAMVVIALLVALGAALLMFGTVAAQQLNEVIRIAPHGFRLFLDRIAADPIGRQMLDQVRGLNVTNATGWATSVVSATAGTVATGLAYTAIGLFVAIYIAAQPQRYRHLCLRLVPRSHRATLERLFDVSGDTLRRWFIGQLVVMAAIGLLSGVGLWLLGIEAAFALGVMGGLLCFIPFVGAILAAVPATLVALTQGPLYAASVIAMYAGVHFIEGNFITPLVQAEATALPPVLALLSTLAFSQLFGPAGVVLAAPLTLFVIITVEILYVQKGLGEPPETQASQIPTENDKSESDH